MDKILKNLKNIEAWIDFNSPPPDFKTHYDFMNLVVEVMNRCLYLLKAGLGSVPDEETANTGYPQHKAIIVGYLVQLTKLYEGALIHICGSQPQLARIFFRAILEIAINIAHLIKFKKQFDQSSPLVPYPSELKMLHELKNKAKTRTLTPIERRINQSILSRLEKDGIAQTELMREDTQNIEKKNTSQFCESLGYNTSLYLYVFRKETDYVHRDWHNIRSHYLTQKGNHYVPDFSLDAPNPRLACHLTQICLETLLVYLEWNKSDPDGLIASTVAKLRELNAALDDAYESILGE